MRPFGGHPPGFILPSPGDVPVGAVTAYAGQVAPPALGASSSGSAWGAPASVEPWGWIACDGRSLVTALYPELFNILGYLYGGSGDSFALPDYRGFFMRGIGGSAATDPDASERHDLAGNAGTGIGSIQYDALLTHYHTYDQATLSGTTPEGSDAAAPTTTTGKTGVPVVPATLARSSERVSQNETRPINIYVNYIIKFTGSLRSPWPL